MGGLLRRLLRLHLSSPDVIIKKNTYIMDLPINDEELTTIVKSLAFGGDTALYEKLKLTKELMDEGLPYKKVLRVRYGIVC